ncbi:fimbrial isopeptide formation D2 family protein [Psychromicrobium silvestre]|uniref:Fimbrial isopeptide formation D2 family protein n=1 Tax=Psychromicrobium silvestre TaxID=1645614 RepID=A0A7Y9S8E1_9MICC|nr:isopeptide-forming domain-containing fimbrial protein [Psychromicrobium silvestre]NYE96365.1 fimbrial isopeptide formation D2 family protein [Psychromicrobium silvestre]
MKSPSIRGRFLAIATTGLLVTSAAVAAITAAPANAASLDSTSPVTAVTLESPYGGTPSRQGPVVSIKAGFDIMLPNPGDTFTVKVPAEFTALIGKAGNVLLSDGTVVGTVALDSADASGSTAIITLGAVVANYTELKGDLHFGATFKDPSTIPVAGMAYSGTVQAGSRSFPVSIPFTASGNLSNFTYGNYWTTPVGDNGGSQSNAFVANTTATYNAADSLNNSMIFDIVSKTTPDQLSGLIGSGGIGTVPSHGGITGDCTSIKVYSLPALVPNPTFPITNGTPLTVGTDYTIDCNAQSPAGTPSGTLDAFRINILHPVNGQSYGVTATFATAGRGSALPVLSSTGPGYYYFTGSLIYDGRLLTDPANSKKYTHAGGNAGINIVDPVGAATAVVATPGLTVTKTADPANAKVKPGQKINYTITAKNTGNIDLSTATITDDLSGVLGAATVDAGSIAASAGTATLSGGKLSWTGPVAVGATVTISYSVTVNQNASNGATVKNQVSGQGAGVRGGSSKAPSVSTSNIVSAPATPPVVTPSQEPSTTPAIVPQGNTDEAQPMVDAGTVGQSTSPNPWIVGGGIVGVILALLGLALAAAKLRTRRQH